MMRVLTIAWLTSVATIWCPEPAFSQPRKADVAASALEPENIPFAKPEILSDDELSAVLSRRTDSQLGETLGNFAKMFLVNSRLNMGVGIGFGTEDRKVMKVELQHSFPDSYDPTLRELLDAIALQTSTEWSYEKTGKYFETSIRSPKPVQDIAIFELKKIKREKPFKVDVAKGWRAADKGHWMMYIPRAFPVGMDIYEFGTYSPTQKENEQKFFDRIRTEVSLDWARRVQPKAKPDDLKKAMVGQFEALHYDTLLTGQTGQEIRWRQWVFMDGNKCYFIVSTIIPDLEEKIYPDVKQMLESFEIKKPELRKE